MVHRVESAAGNVSLLLVARILDALGARVRIEVRSPMLADRRRQADPVHARTAGYVERRLRRLGWVVAREVEVVRAGARGYVDLLAWHPATSCLLVIEIKTQLDDLGAIERTLTWYGHVALDAARSRGWRPRLVRAALIVLATDRVEARLADNRAALAGAFPVRARELAGLLERGWPGTLSDDASRVGVRALALVDPGRRSARWLLAARMDGRRTVAPYRDYADAASRLAGGAGGRRRVVPSMRP